MILDVIASVIIIAVMIQGFRNGFLYTFFHTVGWIVSVIAAFFAKPFVIKFVNKYTDIHDIFYGHVREAFFNSPKSDITSQADYLPFVIREPLIKGLRFAGEEAKNIMADKTSAILYHISVLIVLTVIIQILINVLLFFISKRSGSGIFSGVDGFFGLITGIIKGIIIVFISLAVLIPINGLLNLPLLTDLIQQSKLVKILYENNVIMLFIKNLVTFK